MTRTRTRYGATPWETELPASKRPSYPALRGDADARVVIVGGGLTGAAAAYACAVAGLRPVLLERDRLAHGATARSAGFLLPDPHHSFRAASDAHGVRAARQAFELWRRGTVDAAVLLRRLRLRPALEPLDLLMLDPVGDGRMLRRELDARRAAGFEDTWLGPKVLAALTPVDAGGAIRVRGAFSIDPVRATLALARAAAARGAVVHEHTHVTKVRFDRRAAEVQTDGGTLAAAHVIVATGHPTREFQQLRRHFKMREAYLTVSEPMPSAMRKALGAPGLVLATGATHGELLAWRADARLLVCGADQDETPVRARPAVLVQRTGQLMYETLRRFPVISGLQPGYGWDAAYGETADGLMYVGPHRNYPHHLFALGGSPVSVTGAFVAARLLARAVLGDARRGDDVLGWTR